MSLHDRYLDPPEVEECQKCGGTLVENRRDRSVSCQDCPFEDGVDWDAIADDLKNRW